MIKKIAPVVLLIALGVGLVSFFSNKVSNEGSSEGYVKVALLLPLSGPFGGIGEGIKNASLMAVEDYKLTNPNLQVDIVVEDDSFEVVKGISAYNKLTTVEKVAGIMMISTPVLDALHEEMKEDGLPIVSIGLQSEGVGPDNIFQTTLAPIAPIEFLAQFVDGKNHQKVAVIYTNTLPAINSFHDAFVQNYSKSKASFVVTDAQTARNVATKIVSENFDAVVILQDAVAGPLVTRELKTLDTNNELTYYYDLQLATSWTEYKKILGDTNKLNDSYTLSIKGGDTSAFAQQYEIKYGVPPTPFAEYGYDSTLLLIKGYDQDTTVWVSNIQNDRFVGPSGEMAFDEDGVRLQEIEVIVVENGTISQ